jgi:hypothetical protein
MPESFDELVKINKEKYDKVFSAHLTNTYECVFRPLTVFEYEKIEGDESLTSAEAEDIIVSKCVFWPEDFSVNDFQAGLISSLAEEILESSHLSSVEAAQNALLVSRQKSNTITSMMKSTVLALKDTLGFTLEDLNGMTFEQLCEKVTLAEQIIKVQKTLYDPSVELEISFGSNTEEVEEVQDQTALKLQQALYGQ